MDWNTAKRVVRRQIWCSIVMETLAEAASKDGKWYEAVLSRKTFQP